MPENSLALNSDVNRLATATGYAVNGAFDFSFAISQCTSFKLQGSTDGGSTYADIASTSTPLGASGTLTAANCYMLSLTRCRFTHIKPVFAGTNPSVIGIRRYIRQAPIVSLDKTKQYTLIDPQLGTP